MAEETSNEALQELESGVPVKQIKEGEKFSHRLHLMVDLLDTKFKLIEKQLAQEKKLRMELEERFEKHETRLNWLEGREQVRVDAEEALRLKEEEERLAAERAAAEAEALRLAAEEQQRREEEARQQALLAQQQAEEERQRKAREEAEKCQFINEAKA